MIHGLFIGCNYTGTANELPDCELDAERLDDEFAPFLKSGKVLLSNQATRNGMIAALESLKKKMKAGDLALVAYSGHGTTDTIDGKLVQAIVPNDFELIYEFELRRMLTDLGTAALMADSCYSGGLTRSMAAGSRFISISRCRPHAVNLPSRKPAAPHAVYSACGPRETAASTGNGGAMTLAILEAFRERKDATTFASLATRVKKLLPSREYMQHPQFTCKNKDFAKRTLRSFNRKVGK